MASIGATYSSNAAHSCQEWRGVRLWRKGFALFDGGWVFLGGGFGVFDLASGFLPDLPFPGDFLPTVALHPRAENLTKRLKSGLLRNNSRPIWATVVVSKFVL